jgi:hypothetical protein
MAGSDFATTPSVPSELGQDLPLYITCFTLEQY